MRYLMFAVMTVCLLIPDPGRAASRRPASAKIGPMLTDLHNEFRRHVSHRRRAETFRSWNPIARVSGGYIAIDAIALHDSAALEADLAALGVENLSRRDRHVSGLAPLPALEAIGQLGSLAFARPVLATTNAGSGTGLVTTQGDRSMRTDEVRDLYDVDGTGIRVGVLSDSFDCAVPESLGGPVFTTAAEDFDNGDLPADVIVLEDIADSGCIDEGRAMLQLIHDVAPGASGAFHTAFIGEADFAEGIVELALEAKSDVIVDDVIYFAEPMFQDGIIAQAADYVASIGVPYFSSAGNNWRFSYEDSFRPTEENGISGPRHDFDPGPDIDTLQDVFVSEGGVVLLSFQWDEPFFSVSGPPGSASDLDLVFYDETGVPLPDCASGAPICQLEAIDPNNIGADAVDMPVILNAGPAAIFQVGLELAGGPAPTRVKYVSFEFQGFFDQVEHFTASGTTYGHANAGGAEAVGASAYVFTEEFSDFGDQLGYSCSPACVNDFSSAGGVPILLDTDGAHLPEPEYREKPGIVGPDGGNTSFFFSDFEGDGYPNFFGTSASAPHVAAITALLLDFTQAGINHTVKFWKRTRTYSTICLQPRGFLAHFFDGFTFVVKPKQATRLVEKGRATLGPCHRAPAEDLYDLLRRTAQDMDTGIAFFVFGPAFQTFPVGGPGFDYDTGYGFVDAVAAFEELLAGDGYLEGLSE